MDALTRPFDPARPAHGPLVPFPLAGLRPFGGAVLLAVAAGHAGVLSLEVMRVVGVGSFHGGALGAPPAAARGGGPGRGPPAPGAPRARPGGGVGGPPCPCRPRGRWAPPSAWARRSGT